jgi:TRAP-type C4-dicarboxylate transport system permease small subunit
MRVAARDKRMKGTLPVLKILIRGMHLVSATALASAVVLTVTDVILRRFRMPIDCCYEIVVLLGAIAIGFSIPQTTLDRAHVRMDFMTSKVSGPWRKVLGTGTRFLGIMVFGVLGWRIFRLGENLAQSGQVSAVLELPEYPVAYGISACCFVVCLVLIHELIETVRGVKG